MAILASVPLCHSQQSGQSKLEPEIEAKVSALLEKMTLTEKIAYLRNSMDGESKLPDPGSAEALHGVVAKVIFGHGQSIPTTSFGQVIGMGETWDPALIQRAGAAMGYEARYITQSKKYVRPTLVLWAPNADLARDPRWGRDEESYGEDPFLTGTMAAAYTRGIQGNDPRYWQAAALVKHFFANSNETTRGSSSSNFDERLMREYYSVPFRMAFIDGGARSFMTSYNAWNGIPMTVNPVLKLLLQAQWHVDGIVSSDAGAVENLVNLHKYESTMEDAYAASVKAGVNQFLSFGKDDQITPAIKDGKLTEADLDAAIRGRLRTAIRLGLMDKASDVPYSQIGREGEPEPWTQPAHKEIARQVVEESIVLLKNESEFLPLNRDKVKTIAVIGPNADKVLVGGLYDPVMLYSISPLDGIRQLAGPGITVTFTPDNHDGAAVIAAKKADVAVVAVGDKPFCGSTNIMEAFNTDASTKPCPDPGWAREGRDRETLDLSEEELVKAVYAANPHTVLVLVSGYPFSVNWSQEHVPAILHLAHSSQEQGTGLAEVLFGDYNPAGRVTQTWPASVSQLPPMMDYDIRHGRTYMYSTVKPLYAFGHGLSYTQFDYSNLHVSKTNASAADTISVTLDVKNAGKRDGDEVVQMYVSHSGSTVQRPIQELKAFRRISIAAGATQKVTFELPIQSLAYWDEKAHAFRVESDHVEVRVGAASDDIRLKDAFSIASK
jgi:beta-glucosidase